jgi:dihydrofolate reductase
MKIYSILACDDNYGIGKNNIIPWKFKEDLEFFRNKTINNIIIMGRKTFESLNYKPLKNRINIVLTSNILLSNSFVNDDSTSIHFVNNGIEDAINYCKNNFDLESKIIYIIGGKSLYEYCINNKICDKLYITRIKGDYNCDVKIDIDIQTNYKLINRIILTINNLIVEEWDTI